MNCINCSVVHINQVLGDIIIILQNSWNSFEILSKFFVSNHHSKLGFLSVSNLCDIDGDEAYL